VELEQYAVCQKTAIDSIPFTCPSGQGTNGLFKLTWNSALIPCDALKGH
jgi:hypothetical protein